MMPLRPTLHIDLAALKRNYVFLQSIRPDAQTAGVVKADAYGLGVSKIAPALLEAGCKMLYVAYSFEGAALREMIGPSAEIVVFNGPHESDISLYETADLTPVLNTPEQITLWSQRDRGRCQLKNNATVK